MEIILIAAMAANRVIGDSVTNSIPWHVQGEQQRFKETTMGSPLVMGRKTYESIGRPLPGRKMIIISRDKNYKAAGCQVVHSVEEALRQGAGREKMFIIGGAEIYRQTMKYADAIILTTLQRQVPGDTFFPEFSPEQFQIARHEEILTPEPYSITTYRRTPSR